MLAFQNDGKSGYHGLVFLHLNKSYFFKLGNLIGLFYKTLLINMESFFREAKSAVSHFKALFKSQKKPTGSEQEGCISFNEPLVPDWLPTVNSQESVILSHLSINYQKSSWQYFDQIQHSINFLRKRDLGGN